MVCLFYFRLIIFQLIILKTIKSNSFLCKLDGGSDWLSIKIKNVETGQELKETLKFCRFTTIRWTLDNAGFFYSGYLQTKNMNDPESKKNHKIFYHK